MSEIKCRVRSLYEGSVETRLAAIVESSYDAILAKDVDGVITDWNGAAERLFGYSADEAIGQPVFMMIPEDLWDEENEIIASIRRGERVESFETTRRRKDGILISVSLTISPITDHEGVVVGASTIARDITAIEESERRIRLLLREINHRVKNQYAVILSMVRATGKNVTSAEDFQDRIEDRIASMARAHDLLVNAEWRGADLSELIRSQLDPFGYDSHISLSGPAVTLKPAAVQVIGMAFHELGTNSAKYGALSHAEGAVEIRWEFAGSTFSLTWQEMWDEEEGAFVDRPGRAGFGTVVLKRATPQVLKGKAKIERSPGRLRWHLLAPAETAAALSRR